jgi:hypothetical protein
MIAVGSVALAVIALGAMFVNNIRHDGVNPVPAYERPIADRH